MVDIPQFDLPFRFVNGKEVVVEQDSDEDVENCVEAILRTVQGDREDLPDFGILDMTFRPQPLNLDLVVADILANEPRAQVLIEQHPDIVSSLIARVQVQVATREVSGA